MFSVAIQFKLIYTWNFDPKDWKDTRVADRIKGKPYLPHTMVPGTESSTLSPSISHLYMASLSPPADGGPIHVGKEGH